MTHNDVYWDDAMLTYGGTQPAPTAAPPAPAPTSAVAPAPTGTVVHVVQQGDTLYGIAHRYGVDMGAIVRANGIVNPDRIHVGQRLTIASTTTPPATPEPQTTPTPAPSEGAPSGGVYIVQPGDSLYRIGLRFGVSVSALARANGIANPNLILVGQRLIIPGATP
ncbi:MAG: LysM peptidoglycan-binding domain-containing protein [Anaerolineales bacterium]|nr:LysM peptidoglycan-binding domain-containing protein [Anaerolineales bacterium]